MYLAQKKPFTTAAVRLFDVVAAKIKQVFGIGKKNGGKMLFLRENWFGMDEKFFERRIKFLYVMVGILAVTQFIMVISSLLF